jgi:hypothetical protein
LAVASEVRLNSPSLSQLLVDSGFPPGGQSSNYLQILDPYHNYNVVGLPSFAPRYLDVVAAIPRSGALLPDTFVTVSSASDGSLTSVVETWTGFPPQRVDTFSIAKPLYRLVVSIISTLIRVTNSFFPLCLDWSLLI